MLAEHKEVCLRTNSAQSVRLEKGTTDFKNFFKQIPFEFKFYADFEFNLIKIESYEGYCSKNIKYRSL